MILLDKLRDTFGNIMLDVDVDEKITAIRRRALSHDESRANFDKEIVSFLKYMLDDVHRNRDELEKYRQGGKYKEMESKLSLMTNDNRAQELKILALEEKIKSLKEELGITKNKLNARLI